MNKRKITILSLVALMLFTSVGCNKKEDGQARLLRLAHNQGEDHPAHKAMLEFEKKVEELSDGELDIEVYPNEILGSQREAVELTQTGAVDIAFASISLLESFEPKYSVFNLPYLFDDREHFFNVMGNEEIMDEFYQATRNDGFVGLTWYDAGVRNIYSNKPINTPEDLKGLKIRVQQSPTNIKMIELLGGSPTPMGFGEVYTALQQSVIDGAENNELALTNNKHGEVSKYYSYNQHAIIPDILVMNSSLFDELSEKNRNAILEAAKYSTEFEIEEWEKETEVAKEEATKMGVEFIYPETKPFQDLVMPLHEEFTKDPEIKTIYDKIRSN